MLIGVALEQYDLETGRPRSLSALADQAVRAEELGFASVWVMDHFWMSRDDGIRRGGHEPLAILAHLAARTRRVALGTLVVCNTFRHPAQLAREAAAISDASGGRLILGIGAGWSEPEHRAVGLPFDHLVSRLEESLTVLGPLLRGERVSFEGRFVRLEDAEVLCTAPAPPVWVGGQGPRVLRLTARLADGWNLVWPGADTEPFRRLCAGLRAEVEAAGRSADAVTPSVGLLVLPADPSVPGDAERLRRLAGGDPRVNVVTPSALEAMLAAYRDAGARHVVLSLAPAPFAHADPAFMERAAAVLPRLRPQPAAGR
jgi:alkanesulfonate monooxygenase SsuD/methylene tetrahydromethanopterin reductase-like flavin-dependent oxidoreductase (luciferase family)